MKRNCTGWSHWLVVACLVTSGVVGTSHADENPRTSEDGAAAAAAANESEVAEAKPVHEREEIVAMWQKNNELRESVGLAPHRLSPVLCKAAQDHAEYMARTGVFDHYANGGPSGRAARYEYSGSVRENIAMGYGSVESAFAGWRSSGGHWASIVSGTQEAGFGYAVSAGGAPYYVGVYGYPVQRVAKPVIAESEEDTEDSQDNGTVTEESNDGGVVYTTRRSRRRGRRRR